MFAGKPIIGIAGGIGSGKSRVAAVFAEMGCHVIDSDQQVREAYRDPRIIQQLRTWWGDSVLLPNGQVDRQAIAHKIFESAPQRRQLEQLLHPWVTAAREREMGSTASNDRVIAFVWDTPLLFENGLNRACDAVVFVDAPAADRLKRLAAQRGWTPREVSRREILQWPLDKKQQLSDYVLDNTAEAADLRSPIRAVLTRILEQAKNRGIVSDQTGG